MINLFLNMMMGIVTVVITLFITNASSDVETVLV